MAGGGVEEWLGKWRQKLVKTKGVVVMVLPKEEGRDRVFLFNSLSQ